jgi:hypothetical protein
MRLCDHCCNLCNLIWRVLFVGSAKRHMGTAAPHQGAELLAYMLLPLSPSTLKRTSSATSLCLTTVVTLPACASVDLKAVSYPAIFHQRTS